LCIMLAEFTKEIGWMIKDTEEVMKNMPMVISIKENTRMVKLKGRAYTFGKTENHLMVNGLMEQKRVMAYGEVRVVIHILVSGRTARPRDMASTHGKMEIDMKVNGYLVSDMEMELISLRMVISTRDSINWASLMVMVNINGKMVIFTLAYLRMD